MWKGKRLSTRIKATVSFFPFQSTVNAYLQLKLHLAKYMAFICGIFVDYVVAYVKVTNIPRVTSRQRQREVFSEPKNERSKKRWQRDVPVVSLG